MQIHVSDQRSARVWYWLLPVVFLVHDAEELVTMPGWVASNRAQLAVMLHGAGLGDGMLELLPTTNTHVAWAIGVLLAVFVAVTAGAWLGPGRGAWQRAYAVLLGGFFLHTFTHIGQAVYFGGYTPGVVTAVAVVVPASLYLYSRLLGGGIVTGRAAVLSAVVGIVLLAPAVLVALAAGARLASR